MKTKKLGIQVPNYPPQMIHCKQQLQQKLNNRTTFIQFGTLQWWLESIRCYETTDSFVFDAN